MTDNNYLANVGGYVPVWDITDRLRKARESAGLDQRALAGRLGIGHATVGNYERGVTTPKRPLLLAWAMATGVDLPWLVGDDTSPAAGSDGAGSVRHQGLEPRTRCLTVVPDVHNAVAS